MKTSTLLTWRVVSGALFTLLAAMACQAQKQMTSTFAMPVQVQATVNMSGCDNAPGPQITLDGAVELGGLNIQLTMARFIFRNNDNPVGGPHEADRFADVTLIPPGLTLQFPKQPVLGGVGGNPWIYALFQQGDGTPIGKEVLLGRCVQLAPGN